jgi:predicted DNA-binding transcriptional regulator YafY
MKKDLHQRLKTLLFLVPYVVRHRGVLLSDLAGRLAMSEQELIKELDFLLMVGRPPFLPNDLILIYQEEGKVFVDLHQSLETPPQFTVFEALALATATQLFTNQEEMGAAATAVRGAMEKVAGSLPKETRKLFGDLSDRFLLLPGGGVPHLELLRRAVEERREVELEYFAASRGETTRRTVQPLGMVYNQGVWYLAAFCTQREDKRVFRLSRILKADLSDRIFDPQEEEFDATAFVKESVTVPLRGLQEVVIRFSPGVARWVQERWGSEYLSTDTDGSVVARLHDVSDEFVLSYVASFGGEARIEKPEELGERLRGQASSALSVYS